AAEAPGGPVRTRPRRGRSCAGRVLAHRILESESRRNGRRGAIVRGPVLRARVNPPMVARLGPALGLLPALVAGDSATAPSPPPAWLTLLPQWSPFMVVQPDDAALNGYRDALSQLAGRRAVAGVRIQLFADGRAGPTVSVATSLRLDVLGILDNA